MASKNEERGQVSILITTENYYYKNVFFFFSILALTAPIINVSLKYHTTAYFLFCLNDVNKAESQLGYCSLWIVGIFHMKPPRADFILHLLNSKNQCAAYEHIMQQAGTSKERNCIMYIKLKSCKEFQEIV